MRTVEHKIILKSEMGVGARAPLELMGYLFQHTGRLVRGAVLMAFERRSRTPGRNPGWLNAATDLRFLGTSGERDTLLHFTAPRLGDAAPFLYQQLDLDFPDLEPFRPSGEKTGFDLLAEAVADVTRQDEDSARFDQPLLLNLLRLNRLFNGTYHAIGMVGSGIDAPSTVLDRNTLVSAERLKMEIPAPSRARIVGKLDMIRDSTQSFAIQLEDGHEVPGTLVRGEMDALKDLFNQRVLVLGRAIFRPSGRLLRVDADAVLPGEGESAFWSRMPKPRRRQRLQDVRQPQGPTTGAAAIYGKWPGDETEEELLQALSEMG